MISFIWPLALAVLSNVAYQICAKSLPEGMNPLASLTVTYLVAALASAILYYLLGHDGNLIREYSRLNPAPFLLGLVIVGLELGFIYAYKAGWQVSVFSVVQSSFLAVALIFVGLLLYQEALSRNKLLGVAICLAGLFVVNLK